MPEPGDKVRSALVDGAHDLKAKYEEIYSSDVWLYKKSHGVHSVIMSQIADLLPGARMLDAGCGAGRLALMCATAAREVVGVDFAEGAIRIAQACADACDVSNVTYLVDELESYGTDQPFDIVAIVGTLEHVPDPEATLARINALLRVGGTAVVSCPNFLNFRGHTYMTMLTLLGLPMSLADVRQVTYRDIRTWAAQTGFEHAGSVGAIYRFAWDDKAVEDMVKRVPAALRDKALGIDVDLDAYGAWLRSMVEVNRAYLDALEEQGLVSRISRPAKLQASRPEGVEDGLWEMMASYLDEDIETDPYYSSVEPFCFQGGEAIYLLRKQG